MAAQVAASPVTAASPLQRLAAGAPSTAVAPVTPSAYGPAVPVPPPAPVSLPRPAPLSRGAIGEGDLSFGDGPPSSSRLGRHLEESGYAAWHPRCYDRTLSGGGPPVHYDNGDAPRTPVSPARHEPYYGGVSRFPSAHSAPLRGYTPKRRSPSTPPWEKEVRLGELQRL